MTQLPSLRPIDLIVVTAGRLASTTAFRIVYPLLPFLSHRFDISLQQGATLIAIQTAASLASPIGGALSDRFGERKAMLIALTLFITGAFSCSFASGFMAFLVGYLLIGLATTLYLPSGQAYLSARSPYEQRARVLGVFEMAWAVSAIIGVAPLMYLINQQQQSMVAYAVLACLGILSFVMLWQLPEHHHSVPYEQRTHEKFNIVKFLRQPGLAILLLFPFLTFGGNDLFFITQSTWLKSAFGANEAMIGGLFVIIGIAELAGSSAVVAFADRIGKRRSVIWGFLLTGICLALLPFVGSNWWVVTVMMFLFYFFIEYAIVASFPLISEALPAARGTMMAMTSAAVGIGRIFSSQSSEFLYLSGGLPLISAVAVITSVLGLIALTRSSLTPKR
ncbi:MAG: MFS transporter [Chloroflexales bacterium]|nr:MFS transporter [Chloroflexales bacterium]